MGRERVGRSAGSWREVFEIEQSCLKMRMVNRTGEPVEAPPVRVGRARMYLRAAVYSTSKASTTIQLQQPAGFQVPVTLIVIV